VCGRRADVWNVKLATHLVLYDGECPLCTYQMRMITRLDWLHVFAPLPISDPRAQAVVPGVPREQLEEAIHCVTTEGKIHRGARCIRFVGMRLPLLAPVALFLWIPGVIQLAEVGYRWISRHRLHLSRLFGCKTCTHLHGQQRKQSGEH